MQQSDARVGPICTNAGNENQIARDTWTARSNTPNANTFLAEPVRPADLLLALPQLFRWDGREA